MLKKTLAVVGVTAVIVAGAGTAAIAASGSPTPAAPASSSTSATDEFVANSTTVSSAEKAAEGSANRSKPGAGKHRGDRIRKAVHATWVTRDKETNAFTTHDAIRGRVTAVSPTSITVRAVDDVTQTYLLNSGTKVRARGDKGAGSISDVKTGDPVIVGGTGTTTLTAVRVIDAKK